MSKGGEKEVKVKFPDNLLGGAYSNNMFVTHTKEEFILDYLMVSPPTGGTVTSRVIISPGHMKRMIVALQDNVKKYEDKFGQIDAAEEPKLQGFNSPIKH
ncbi:MAG: DUF3467 domain-containing protein [Deltaproteobacteria bacterium]|nr:DUF3467 domain-containing protein [Deltaproteobacteria bacterium]